MQQNCIVCNISDRLVCKCFLKTILLLQNMFSLHVKLPSYIKNRGVLIWQIRNNLVIVVSRRICCLLKAETKVENFCLSLVFAVHKEAILFAYTYFLDSFFDDIVKWLIKCSNWFSCNATYYIINVLWYKATFVYKHIMWYFLRMHTYQWESQCVWTS